MRLAATLRTLHSVHYVCNRHWQTVVRETCESRSMTRKQNKRKEKNQVPAHIRLLLVHSIADNKALMTVKL